MLTCYSIKLLWLELLIVDVVNSNSSGIQTVDTSTVQVPFHFQTNKTNRSAAGHISSQELERPESSEHSSPEKL